jgi:hypothetical protein
MTQDLRQKTDAAQSTLLHDNSNFAVVQPLIAMKEDHHGT